MTIHLTMGGLRDTLYDKRIYFAWLTDTVTNRWTTCLTKAYTLPNKWTLHLTKQLSLPAWLNGLLNKQQTN